MTTPPPRPRVNRAKLIANLERGLNDPRVSEKTKADARVALSLLRKVDAYLKRKAAEAAEDR